MLICVTSTKLLAEYIGQARASGCAVQSDGNILAAGTATLDNANQFVVARYTSTGILDTTFNGDGITTTLLAIRQMDWILAFNPMDIVWFLAIVVLVELLK